MANKRIKDISTTATSAASDDFVVIDGAANGTRKIDARPLGGVFDENVTVTGEVAASTRVAADTYNGYTGGSTPLTVQTGGAQNLILGTDNTERLRIQSDGKFAYGHSTPNAEFSIKGDTEFLDGDTGTRIGLLYDNGTEGIFELRDNNTTKVSLRSAGNSSLTGGGLGVGADPGSTKLRVSGGSGQLFKVDDGGNALVTVEATGATTIGPGAALTLDTAGNLILQKGGGAYVQLKDATAVRGAINVGTSDGLTFTTGASFSTAMQIDSAGNVAIGHGAFGAKLDIATATNTAGIFIRDNSDSSITHQIYNSSGNGNLAIYADGQVAKVNINSAGNSYFNGGNVGIGTNSPDQLIHASSATGASLRLERNSDTITSGQSLGAVEWEGRDASGSYAAAGVRAKIEAEATGSFGESSLKFYTATGSTAAANRVTIDSSGRLMVGSGSPARPLHVLGNGTLAQFESTSNTPYVSLKDPGGTHTYLGNAAGDFVIQTADGSYSSKLVVYNGGNVAVPHGNLVMSAGNGIYFDNSTDASGAATEILSDYERGSFVPSFSSSVGSFTTMSVNVINATYVKIGDLVTFCCYFRTDDVDATGAGGSLIMTGLPYAASVSSGSNFSAVTVGYAASWSNAPAGGYVPSGQSRVVLTKRSTSITGVLSDMAPADMTAGTTGAQNQIMMTGSYAVL